MPVEVTPRRAIDRDPYEWNYHDRQDHMRNQNGYIKRANKSLPQEASVAMVVVIGKIGNQEKGRRSHRRDLTVAMTSNEVCPNKAIARYQQEGTS